MAETLLHLIGLRAESTPGLVKWFFKSCKSKNKNSRSGVRWRNHFTDQRKFAPIFWNIHYSLLSYSCLWFSITVFRRDDLENQDRRYKTWKGCHVFKDLICWPTAFQLLLSSNPRLDVQKWTRSIRKQQVDVSTAPLMIRTFVETG